MKIPVEKILPNPRQPRTRFDEEGLRILAGSLKEHGLVQAITVEERSAGQFWLIAGERRWRAARMLGWDEIEAVVVPSMNGQGDRRRLAMALVENVHREQMDPIDIGQAYQDLIDTGLTNKQVAEMVGRSESNVWLYRAILKLEPEIRELYRSGRIPLDQRIIHLLRKLTPEQRLALVPRLKKPGTVATRLNLLKNALLHGEIKSWGPDGEREKQPKFPAGTAPSVRLGAKGGFDDDAVYQAATKTCEQCDFGSDPVDSICKACPAVAMVTLLTE